jgi:thiol-disulfide isomerase/thioredoxin
MKLFLFLFGFFFSISFSGFSQEYRKSDITIRFSPSFYPEKFKIIYSDGIRGYYNPKAKLTWLKIERQFQSTFASIEVLYPNDDKNVSYSRAGFFVSDKPAEIRFFKNDTSENRLASHKLVNAWTFDEMGASSYNKYNENETRDYDNFYTIYAHMIQNSDSLKQILKGKEEAKNNKSIEFIKDHGDLYYSFWAFRNLIKPTAKVDVDSLLVILDTAFPAKYRNSYEGIKYRNYLRSRLIRKDESSPDFEIIDINGNVISSKDYKDHLMLIFWASWCRPCIKEMPVINKMKEAYSGKKLDFLFVTSDKDSSKFERAIDQHNIAWGTHTFLDENLKAKFGVSSIPKIYLISPDGYILYSNQEEDDEDLNKLVQVLIKKIN